MKVVKPDGSTEHSDWFNTMELLRNAMERVNRPMHWKYFVQERNYACDDPDCGVERDVVVEYALDRG